MSLKKAIASGKEHRKDFRGSERFDKTCRCHGGCPYCLGNRMHSTIVRKEAAKEELRDYYADIEKEEN